MREIGHFIGGKHVAGTSGRTPGRHAADGRHGARPRWRWPRKAELRAAVENAKAAQPAWAATNPQRRVRVLMKFLELVSREYDALAELLAREHGKTIADAKGDIQRGLEVVEVCIGAPHHDEGRIHRRRRPRHRRLFDAPAARRRRRHHAVQFPGDDPAVEDARRRSPAATPSS